MIRPDTHQAGIALFTILMVLLGLIIIGLGVLTLTSLGDRMAGSHRTAESAASAAEACFGPALRIIQETIDAGSLPAALLDNANPPGPVPAGNAVMLNGEIMGQSNSDPDTADSAPNTVATVNGFTVRGDIDRLFIKPKAGGAVQSSAGYEGTGSGAATGGVEILYRVDCMSTHPVTNASARITVVYACTVTGESCQRKL